MSETIKPAAGALAAHACRPGLVDRLLMPSNVLAEMKPGGRAVEKLMNQHVNRRSIMGASVGLAAIAMPVAAVAAAADHVGSANLLTLPGVAPELQVLKKAFDVEFRKFEKIRKIWSAAERRYLEIRPPQPERIIADFEKSLAYIGAKGLGQQIDRADLEHVEQVMRTNRDREQAWQAACEVAHKESGFAAAESPFGRQFDRADRAAARILRFKARSVDDILVKFEVHRKWVFEEASFVAVMSTDINRIAKARRQSVSRGTAAVTA